MSDLSSDQLWELVDQLDQLPTSRELEIDRLMMCEGYDRDEAELLVGPPNTPDPTTQTND